MAPKMEMQQIHAFADELACEMNAKVDPLYSGHHWAFALILSPGVRLFAEIENGKAQYRLVAFASNGRARSIDVHCGVAVSRGAAVAAEQIRKRLLPDAVPLVREAIEAFRDEDAAIARVTKKAGTLAKKYPNLKIKLRDDGCSIAVSTKYGAGIHLDAYVYEESAGGKWRLTSDRGNTFALDDVDAKYGRAILKLCNEN